MNARNANRLLTLTEALIRKETDIARRYALFAARDHIKTACDYLAKSDNERAGIHLDAAKWILKGVRA